MTHHRTHRPGKTPVLDTRSDPHSAFEMGGFVRALFSSIFYEEVQLFFDIRDGQLTKSRWITLIIYLPLQILFLMAFGWQKYLVVLAATRFTGGISWFVFSHVIHRSFVYRFGFIKQVPIPVRWMLGVSNGIRTMVGVLHHATHHAWPSMPYSRQDEFDSALVRNPEAAPVMIPSRQ
jgi:hypothetical protein